MPSYEVPLLLRIMKKPETFEVLKRAAVAIFNNGGFIRKIENLGQKELPLKIRHRGTTHREASYFVFYFDMAPSKLDKLLDEYNRDIDILKNRIHNQQNYEKQKCTLEEELLPPIERKDVQEMLSLEKIHKSRHQKLQYSRELKYYPSAKQPLEISNES